MITLNCKTNSITLSAGESFVLPPGATLLGVTNIANITSECMDLSSLEQAECYGALIGSHNEISSITEEYYWENTSNAYACTGYELNGVKFTFPTPVPGPNDSTLGGYKGCLDGDAIATALKAAMPGVIDHVTYYNHEGEGYDGDVAVCMTLIVIKTFPSIGTKLKLIFASDVSTLGPEAKVEMLVEFKSLDAFASYEFKKGIGGSVVAVECPPDPEN